MSALDREMAYADWASSCRTPHPDRDDIACRRSTRPHSEHAAGYGTARVFWPNTDDPRPDFPVVPVARRGNAAP